MLTLRIGNFRRGKTVFLPIPPSRTGFPSVSNEMAENRFETVVVYFSTD